MRFRRCFMSRSLRLTFTNIRTSALTFTFRPRLTALRASIEVFFRHARNTEFDLSDLIVDCLNKRIFQTILLDGSVDLENFLLSLD